MANSKKADSTRKIIDVAHPDTSAADSSAKPVIVTNRPMMKDPMVVGEDEKAGTIPEHEKDTDLKPPSAARIEPLSPPTVPEETTSETNKKKAEATEEEAAPVEEDKQEAAEANKEEVPEKKPQPTEETETEPEPETESEDPKAETKPTETSDQEEDQPSEESKTEEAKAAKQIEAEAATKKAEYEHGIEKLVESKEYQLPINSVEKRRSRRFVSLGILLSLVLILAWADVALDSGLVNLSANLPHTHFFNPTAASTPVTQSSQPASTPTTLTANDIQAESQVKSISSLLETYYKTNTYYPSDLTTAPLLNQTGNKATIDIFTAPTGTKFVYTAFPSSCTVAAHDCLHYTLKVTTVGGKLISSVHSLH